MTNHVHRANLSAASFPFLSERQGRSVIVVGKDTTYVPQITPKEDSDQNIGVPQLFYCHNVFPTNDGYQSVGYEQRSSIIPSVTDVTRIITVRDIQERIAHIAFTNSGAVYALLPASSGVWMLIAPPAGIAGKRISVAHVAGTSYIYFATVGCYVFNFDTSALEPVVLAGLVSTEILGITAAAGYMLAWKNNFIAWSSTLDETDFVPSLATGAGGGSPEGIRGEIVFCAPVTFGFIVFTTANAVAAIYSNNARFPFNFREISGSGGIASPSLVSYDSNLASIVAYTTSGIQKINVTEATGTLEAASDFLSGGRFEDFDDVSALFSVQNLTSPMKKKVTVVSDRFIVFSYGITELTHALVYDTISKRWGKIKFTHVQCFDYRLNNPAVSDGPDKTIAFVDNAGKIYTLNLTPHSPGTIGVVLLGRYQFSRNYMTSLETVSIDNVESGNTVSVSVASSVDGKSLSFVPATEISRTALTRTYGHSQIGLNHTVMVRGAFDLVSIILDLTTQGRAYG